MAENTDREGEQTMFDMIRGPDDNQNKEDYDGSEFLNNTGEGDMIFDRDDEIDEVMNYDYDDDEEHVDPETTNTGEPSGSSKSSGKMTKRGSNKKLKPGVKYNIEACGRTGKPLAPKKIADKFVR